MAAITTSPFHRTRSTAPVRPATPDAARVQRDTRSDDVPGPDERSLARTTAVVITSLALLIGVLVAAAWGVGTAVSGAVGWFMS